MFDIPNLHSVVSKGITYYRYRLPNGQYQSLGVDAAGAQRMALELNIIRAEKEASRVTMNFVIEEFRPVKLRGSKSDATREIWSSRLDRYAEWIGTWDVSHTTVRMLDDLLLEKAPGYEPYRCHRLLLGELFVYAIGRGWREQSLGNPAKALLPPKLARQREVKRRKRMTLAQFFIIRAVAPEWLQIAMDLALLIGIRRSDVCYLKFSNFDGGYLRFIPAKTADLPTPAAISIKINDELQEIVDRARALRPASEYFIHKHNSFVRTGMAADREDVTQVLPEQLSRKFRAILRSLDEEFAGYDDEELPTYHEVRSLCARTYRDKGWPIEKIQLLLGHADESMTEHYQSGAGVVWQEMKLA